jgi:hypothetical protein
LDLKKKILEKPYNMKDKLSDHDDDDGDDNDDKNDDAK